MLIAFASPIFIARLLGAGLIATGLIATRLISTGLIATLLIAIVEVPALIIAIAALKIAVAPFPTLAVAVVAVATLAVAALIAVVAVAIAVILLAAIVAIQSDFRRHTFDDRLRAVHIRLVAIALIVHVVAVFAVFIVEVVAILLEILDRHRRLRRRDDAIVVLGMLEIILRNDAVAGAHRIASERGVFLGDLLRGTTDLHVRAIALITPRQGVWSLAVVIVATVIVVVPPTHAAVLLLRPHTALFMLKNSAPASRPARLPRTLSTIFARKSRVGVTFIQFRFNPLAGYPRS